MIRVRNTKVDDAIDQREKTFAPELADSGANSQVLSGKAVFANIVSDFEVVHGVSRLG